MSVWYAIPSKRPAAEVAVVLDAWFGQGYEIMVQRDPGDESIPGRWNVVRPYAGYAEAVNHLVGTIVNHDWAAQWIVTGGDDIFPDPNKGADEIAQECCEHFGFCEHLASTWGVMQPTGDRDFGDRQGAYIDRVAGSPWMGREWCLRINQGNGPLWPQYFHCGEDEELQAVASHHGVFWQRPDLTQYHQHWARPQRGELVAPGARCPEFLDRANSPVEWRKYKALFAGRKVNNFPGSEPKWSDNSV
jgi:hypothetical protein